MGSIDALDFIFAIVLGDILGEPLSDGKAPLFGPMCAAAMIAVLHITLSFVALKTPRFRRVLEEEPKILMKHGVILHKELKKAKITLESFLMDLRLSSASDLKEIDYAVLEMNGSISVIKKSAYDAATPNDFQKTPPSKGYSSVFIEDGRIIEANIKKFGTLDWFRELIHRHGYANAKEIFLMTYDESGQVFISPKLKNNSLSSV